MQSTELKSVVLFYLRRSNHVINLNCIKMADQAKCIFEFCEVKNEKINLFTATTLKTCQDKLKIKKICGAKYGDVVLPAEINFLSDGYHRSCYNNVTNTNKKQMEKYEKIIASNTVSEFGKYFLQIFRKSIIESNMTNFT